MRPKACFLCAFPLLVAVSAFPQSPPSVSSVLDAQRQVKNYSSAVISPDGTRVAWVESLVAHDANHLAQLGRALEGHV